MALVDRVNQWVLRRWLRRPGPGTVTVSAESLKIVDGTGVETVIPWKAIRQVKAMARDIYIRPDFLTIFIQWGSGNCIELNEDTQGWADLLAAFDCYLPGAVPSASWLLDLYSIPTSPVRIFDSTPGATGGLSQSVL